MGKTLKANIEYKENEIQHLLFFFNDSIEFLTKIITLSFLTQLLFVKSDEISDMTHPIGHLFWKNHNFENIELSNLGSD